MFERCRPLRPNANTPLTWVLALGFLGLLDFALMRGGLLWGEFAFEREMGSQAVFAQTYRTARKLHSPRAADELRVAILGNSRAQLGASDILVEEELARLAPDTQPRVDNLAIFAAGFGVSEAVSRQLPRMEPDVVVVAVSPTDLLMRPTDPMRRLSTRLLEVGWRDGPVPPDSTAARLDRWLRTAWSVYRHREFIRAAVVDRISGTPVAPQPPERFGSTEAIFEWMKPGEGAATEAAYRAWREDRSLEAFVDYLRVGHRFHLSSVERRMQEEPDLALVDENLAVADVLFASLAAGDHSSLVLLLPENPVLAADVEGRYHRPRLAAELAARLRELAERHGIAVVDARAAMPAEAFLDLDHLLQTLSGFEAIVAEEVLRAHRS